MIHAYDEKYLDDAMRNLGEAFDYAVNSCEIEPDVFLEQFVTGGIGEQFGAGVPKYVAGRSGTELVLEVMSNSEKLQNVSNTFVEYECSPEYWGGWILAYYQWFTGRSFKNIKEHISMEDILKLYPTLHEASEEKFVDVVNGRIRSMHPHTRLHNLRKAAGYSQKELAEKSGVTLRMIQQYEQRVKDINRASGMNLLALARTLGCQIEDLLEYDDVREKRS